MCALAACAGDDPDDTDDTEDDSPGDDDDSPGDDDDDGPGGDTKWSFTFDDGTEWSGNTATSTVFSGRMVLTLRDIQEDGGSKGMVLDVNPIEYGDSGTYTDTATISLTQVTPEGETRLNCGWVNVGDGTMPLSITLDTFTADLIQGTVTVTDLTCTSDSAADTVSGQGWFEL